MSAPLRFLIAEDEALILMQLEFLIEDCGHCVVGTASTASEAIAAARERRPDIVFIDLQLRDGSTGIEIAQALRDEACMTLVFVTANALQFADDFVGAAGVIAKPFTEAVIIDTVSYLETCLRMPSPQTPVPLGLRMDPNFLARLEDRED